MHQTKDSTAWENLTFASNFLFCKIMESEPELCRRILEMLLHIKISGLKKPEAERTMLESTDSKSVRFDVYTGDDQRIFDIEIQTTANRNLPKRARYYQSVIDMGNLSGGEKYSSLKDDEEESFFKFLAGQRAESEFTKSLEEKVSFAKKNMKWRKQYMTWQQTIDEEKDIAFEEDKFDAKVEDAENLIRMNVLSDEQTSLATGLPLEKVLELAKKISVKA